VALDATQAKYLDWLLDPRPQAEGKSAPPEGHKLSRQLFAIRNRTGEYKLDRWEHDPEFVAEWERRIAELSGGPARFQRLLDGLFEVATGNVAATRPADIVAASKLYAELTDRAKPKTTMVVTDPRLVEASDEELIKLAEARNTRLAKIKAAVEREESEDDDDGER